MKKKLLFSAILICLTSFAMAQNRVTGSVKDDKNKALPFVNVALVRTADSTFVCGTASDDNGAFELKDVPNGTYELKALAIGYETAKRQIEVIANMDLEPVVMRQGEITLDEVQVLAKRPLFAVEGEKTFYNVAEDPSIQTGSASDALQNTPGVQVDVEGNITLRGTSSVEVWINDKPSHLSAENLKTYIQQLPANAIDHVEVITNPSARYGSKADGIINIVTNAKIQKNQFVSFGANAAARTFAVPWVSYVWANEKFSMNIYVNGALSKAKGQSVGSQQIYAGPELLSSWSHDSTLFDHRFINGGIYGNANYEINDKNSLMFWGGYGPGMVHPGVDSAFTLRHEFVNQIGDYEYLTTEDSKQTYDFFFSGLYYQHKFNDKGHNLDVSLSCGSYSNKTTDYFTRNFSLPYLYRREVRYVSDNRSPNNSIEVNYNIPYSENGEISVGLSSEYERGFVDYKNDSLVDNMYVMDSLRSYCYDSHVRDHEAYVTLQQKFGGFTVKPGVRFMLYDTDVDYHNVENYDKKYQYQHVMPSLHFSYSTKSMHNFKLSYTHRISDPKAEQRSMYCFYDEDSFRTGNDNLKSIYTHSFEAGWTKFWPTFGYVGISGYYKGKSNDINTISEAVYNGLYGRHVLRMRPVNVGRAYNAGGEFNVTYRPSGMFNVRLYANIYDSYLESDLGLNGDRKGYEMWSYSLQLYVWAKLWNKLEINCSANYNSPTQTLFAETYSNNTVNCGLKSDFFDRKLSVFLNASDIFHGNRFGENADSPSLQSSSSTTYNTRYISVGVVFRFGKMELENMARQGGNDTGNMPMQ